MFFHYFSRTACLRLAAISLSIGSLALWFLADPGATHSQTTITKNFESPQVHPLAMTPDGTRLLAVNSPNGTLSVFQLEVGSAPRLTAEIPVGLEPVSVALRNDSEAWVANWLSDSISIVDLATGNVVRTVEVGDEPTDIIFAGSNREMAFVCVSGGGSLLSGTTLDRLGRGQVKVFDATNPAAAPQTIEIFGKQPRALAKNADGSRVFVSVFESGNQTTIVRELDVRNNGGLPPPNPAVAPGLPQPPNTGLIVKRVGNQWQDETGKSWNNFLPFTLADADIAVINSSGATLPTTVSLNVSGVGTHVGNMAFDPAQGKLLVANLEDTNEIRFEPKLSGHFQQNRITVITNATTGTPTVASTPDLNSHVNLANPAGSASERALSLAMPGDIVRKSDGTFYVAATSSARVGILANDGTVTDRIPVGQGPTGLALDESRQSLYVLNRFDQTISVVDTASKLTTASVAVGFNPEPAAVRNGRKFLYDGDFSAHGTVSCSSCDLNGHRDGMVWDLGNPQGSIDSVATFLPPNINGADNLHPMKGPMMTQTLRGIVGNEPLHWRGDRGGLDNFNSAFMSLLGGPRMLTPSELADFKAFVQTLTYPPNPNEPLGRPANEQHAAFPFFNATPTFGPQGLRCNQCHRINTFDIGSDNRINPAQSLQEPQSFKVTQLRGLYQKQGLDRASTGPQITGFGFSHDGSVDTLFNFQKLPQFIFSTAGTVQIADGWRRDMENLMLRLDTGTAPAVGLMVTVDATNKSTQPVLNRVNLLIAQALTGNCDLVVHGIYGGSPRSFLFQAGQFLPDSLTEAPVTVDTLLAAAGTRAELTFVGVPKGEGRIRSIDSDGDTILNDDEPRTAVQIRARVINSIGSGVPGVTMTLSGSQNARATTDSNGNVVFNYVSTTGNHTLTPTQGGSVFGPSSKSFSSPTTNQIAVFTLPANGPFTTPLGTSSNVVDTTAAFVTQHYADFLNRDPDSAGLAFWSNEINSCGNNAGCVEVKRINVSAAFYLSGEFQQTGGLFYRTYLASFGSLPRFSKFLTEAPRIGRNVIVGQTGWEATLEANKVAFFSGWVQTPNFVTAFPATLTGTQFVEQLDVNAGRVLSESERASLVAILGSAPSNLTKRAQVLRAVVEDSDFQAKEFNRTFVLMEYFGYLRRNPDDPPDTNLDGLNFWLDKLDHFHGNFVDAEMVKAFIISGEYRQRFGP